MNELVIFTNQRGYMLSIVHKVIEALKQADIYTESDRVNPDTFIVSSELSYALEEAFKRSGEYFINQDETIIVPLEVFAEKEELREGVQNCFFVRTVPFSRGDERCNLIQIDYDSLTDVDDDGEIFYTEHYLCDILLPLDKKISDLEIRIQQGLLRSS